MFLSRLQTTSSWQSIAVAVSAFGINSGATFAQRFVPWSTYLHFHALLDNARVIVQRVRLKFLSQPTGETIWLVRSNNPSHEVIVAGAGGYDKNLVQS